MRQDAGAARGGPQSVLGEVDVDVDGVTGAELVGVPGGVEVLAGPAAGGQVVGGRAGGA